MTINNSPDIKFDLEPAPHIHSRMTTSKMMGIVLGALIPAYCVMIYFFGYGVLIQFLICAISCCVAESIAVVEHLLKMIAAESGLVGLFSNIRFHVGGTGA